MIVKQVQYAIRILEFFSERRAPATLAELADHFGWPRSSTFNLIETLAKAGLLYEPRYRAGYYPTPRLLKLAQDIVSHGPVSDRLRECVAHVAERTGETAVLAAPSGVQAIFVDVVESRSPIRYFAHVGQRVPMHATSAGRALLSMYSAAERSALLRKADYVRYAADTLMSADAVEAEIAASASRGWFLNLNGYEPDLLGLAVPMPLRDAQLCLMVAGPAYRTASRVPELAEVLADEVRRYLADETRAGQGD